MHVHVWYVFFLISKKINITWKMNGTSNSKNKFLNSTISTSYENYFSKTQHNF
jgi:hypothetical protein